LDVESDSLSSLHSKRAFRERIQDVRSAFDAEILSPNAQAREHIYLTHLRHSSKHKDLPVFYSMSSCIEFDSPVSRKIGIF
jgi:hypothetical protein